MPSPREIEELLPYLNRDELAQLDALMRDAPVWTPLPGPQTMAYTSKADIVGYGGAAGGGKTDLIVGSMLTYHERCLVVRREKAQTEGIVQRMVEIVGDTKGFNSQKGIWKVAVGTQPLVEFGGLDNVGDEQRWQGRPHDLKAFDEVTEQRESQVRFIMGWNRSSNPNVKQKVLMTFNPPTTAEGRWVLDFFAPWLDPKHPRPALPGELRWFTTINGKDYEVDRRDPFVLAPDGVSRIYSFDPTEYREEDIITPKSRTFIPARVTDNPFYARSGYLSTLQALPEPLRSQMLYGDFRAGIEDDLWQLIPTAWVEAAMARWSEPARLGEMLNVGVDVARGGRDQTTIARRHSGMWFDKPLRYPGTQTPNGAAVAGLVVAAVRDHAPVSIDIVGVGSSPFDYLNDLGLQTVGVNVGEGPTELDKSGMLEFYNLRSQLWWKMREALDPVNNTGIALPPDKELLADLCAPKWEPRGRKVFVESRDDIVGRIGRSPDTGTAYVMALAEVPKRRDFPRYRGPGEHPPGVLASVNPAGAHVSPRGRYDPFDRNRLRR